ncbi:GKN1 protein, partial [Alectura lathami]|nr:GKN1 protein [Alectura lathami]
FQIVAAVLLGLVLTPAFAEYQFQDTKIHRRPSLHRTIQVGLGYQILTIDSDDLLAIIEQKGNQESWKTVWNYQTGYIASRLVPEGVCYISRMNRLVMPTLNSISLLADESKNVKGERLASREIRYYVTRRPVRELRSYGSEIYNLCRGYVTYTASEEQQPTGSQVLYNQDSCNRLNVLNLLGIDYCQ